MLLTIPKLIRFLDKGEMLNKKPFIILNVQDILEAENLILIHLQACAYPEEILCLKQNKPLKKLVPCTN